MTTTFARSVTRLAPGIAVMALVVTVAVVLGRLQNVVGALVIALALGVLVRNLGLFHPVIRPGIQVATKRLLRIGVVVLGLQLSLPEIWALGLPVLALILVCVAVSFVVTMFVGVRFGLSRAGAMLMAAGFSICGASAIAGMQTVVDADDEEVATSVAMVTLYGSLSIVALPLVGTALGLSPETFGIWAGLAVHEVAQVVAAASTAGAVALAVATVVKLGRVVLLAPMAALVSLGERRRADRDRGATDDARRVEAEGSARTGSRPPIVPLFVVGFLALVLVRSTGLVPDGVVAAGSVLATWLLAAAMFGLGTGIDIPRLVKTGGRGLAVGGVSTVVLGGLSLLGAVVVTG
ncbi:putative sulfate exporter family transporter [Labedella phragmitis]|uniref:Putative sulfate exporter family transporter n=1 Tax=Labedella phragmitis TaxID=2498849 RepID=A0A444PYK9_9MICO|nr:putative sulfate exporter family transporter [Labedella phragmitis]RWZ52966.1 putative sulfate exporter family transporter [Labedella phragmitis]